jgi:hypothetical protein
MIRQAKAASFSFIASVWESAEPRNARNSWSCLRDNLFARSSAGDASLFNKGG